MKIKLFHLIFVFIIILIVLGGIHFFKQQSILSVSQVNVEERGNKVYWVATLNVNSLSDEWLRFHYSPSEYTKSNGDRVKPHQSFDISLRIKENYCYYPIGNKDTCAFRTCYRLGNPEKRIVLVVKDSYGRTQQFEPRISGDTLVFQDPDGKGTLTLEYQFVGASIYNCPSPTNIRILENHLINKNQYPNNLYLLPTTVFGGLKIIDDSTFVSFFNNYVINLNDGVKGYVDTSKIGSIVLTVTADQDYFDSVTYKPPTKSKPLIKNINIVSKASTLSTITMNVEVENKGDEGDIILTPSGSLVTFIPSSRKVHLVNNLFVPFQIKVGNTPSTTQICVKACSTSQFGTPNCDTKCKSLQITKTSKTSRCGDGTCDVKFGETPTNCPSDCGKEVSCPKNSVMMNNQCVCISGYKMSYNPRLNKYECVKESPISTTTLLIIGALLIVLVLAISQSKPSQPNTQQK